MAPSRREFLLLRPGRQARVVDLPCGRLYMRYLESRTVPGRHDGDPAADPPQGEPPPDLDTPTVEALFAALARELESAAIVRLVDVEWLAEPGFRREVERVLDDFTARGGRIET